MDILCMKVSQLRISRDVYLTSHRNPGGNTSQTLKPRKGDHWQKGGCAK